MTGSKNKPIKKLFSQPEWLSWLGIVLCTWKVACSILSQGTYWVAVRSLIGARIEGNNGMFIHNLCYVTGLGALGERRMEDDNFTKELL